MRIEVWDALCPYVVVVTCIFGAILNAGCLSGKPGLCVAFEHASKQDILIRSVGNIFDKGLTTESGKIVTNVFYAYNTSGHDIAITTKPGPRVTNVFFTGDSEGDPCSTNAVAPVWQLTDSQGVVVLVHSNMWMWNKPFISERNDALKLWHSGWCPSCVSNSCGGLPLKLETFIPNVRSGNFALTVVFAFDWFDGSQLQHYAIQKDIPVRVEER